MGRESWIDKTTWLFVTLISLCFFWPLSLPPAHAKGAQAAGIAPPGLTRCIKAMCVPTQHALETQTLPLNGFDLFEYWSFNLYTAALYAPRDTNTSDKVLSDIPKSLILHYHRKIRADQIIKAANHNLLKNPANDMSVLSAQVDALHAAFVAVDKGDTYELHYEPGKGTTLLFNGDAKITIPGVDFQRAYFGIWLSEYSLSSKLRDELLGKE